MAEQVSAGFDPPRGIVVPGVHASFTGARGLTTDLIGGVTPRARGELASLGLDADQLLLVGAQAMLKQIFELGVFHADPHPGNLLLLDGDRVCFLDFGLYGRPNRRGARRMAMLLYALGKGDHQTVAASPGSTRRTDFCTRPSPPLLAQELALVGCPSSRSHVACGHRVRLRAHKAP